VLKEALFRAIVARACQTGEVEQNRDFGTGIQRLRREIEVESHVRVRARRLVLQLQQLAAERGNGCGSFESHGAGGQATR